MFFELIIKIEHNAHIVMLFIMFGLMSKNFSIISHPSSSISATGSPSQLPAGVKGVTSWVPAKDSANYRTTVVLKIYISAHFICLARIYY